MVVLQSPGLQYTRPGDRDRELYKWRISFGVRAYTHLHVMVSNIVEGCTWVGACPRRSHFIVGNGIFPRFATSLISVPHRSSALRPTHFPFDFKTLALAHGVPFPFSP